LSGKRKPNYTTTKDAIIAGEAVERLKAVSEKVPYIRGSKSRYKEALEQERFKHVSVFTAFFGESWDLISRIAADPAHELHNLVH
jgi:hypothetical protein